MMDALFYLAPLFLAQFLVAGLLLWLFSREKDNVHAGQILLTSLIFSVLNVLIEWFLGELLLAATLVAQWTFFVLLANRLVSIPLPRASVTLFCFFSLLMGIGMLGERFSGRELSEDEKLLHEGFEEPGGKKKSALEAAWVRRVEAGTLIRKTCASKHWVLDYIYPPEEKDDSAPEPRPIRPPPSSAVDQRPPPPDPGVASAAIPEATPETPHSPSSMSGAEFEKLFFPGTSSPASLVPEVPGPEVTGPPGNEADPVSPPPPPSDPRPARGSPKSITAEQLEAMVGIRNRSTDPGFDPPEYEISAISMGDQGRFAIVDGDMLREGSILHTQLESPRAWRLFRIEQNQVFWQPLK